MNIDQLMESLSENAPDTGDVLASFGRKRRTARNRMYTASGGLAVAVVAVVVGVLLHGAGTGGTSTAESRPVAGVAMPAATPALRSPGFAQGAASNDSAAACDAVRLQANLAEAVRKGASVIVGYGTLTSGSAAVHGAGGGASAYYSLTLRSVQTIAGPKVTSGSIAWIAGAIPVAGTSASSGTASAQPPDFAPGGELFGIVSPSAASGTPGPVLQAAPVSDGQVLLSGPGCWDITASGSQQGEVFGPSQEGPRSALGPANRITEVPLTTAEKLAAQAG
ncbi:MAG: hypothetical protein JWM19_60 [Actinomycetia bacterium]|nr:hypothetical protein [Actinomycetes bacterium]